MRSPMRTLASLVVPLIAALLPAPSLQAQIPGVDVSLKAERSIVPTGKDAVLILTLDVKQAADVPADLVSGTSLTAKAGTAAPVEVKEAGKGGNVPFLAGTRIERKVTVPVSKLLPGGATGSDFTNLEVSWAGQPGASCIVKVAPD